MVQLTNIDVRQHLAQHRKEVKDGEGVYLIEGVADKIMACSKSHGDINELGPHALTSKSRSLGGRCAKPWRRGGM